MTTLLHKKILMDLCIKCIKLYEVSVIAGMWDIKLSCISLHHPSREAAGHHSSLYVTVMTLACNFIPMCVRAHTHTHTHTHTHKYLPSAGPATTWLNTHTSFRFLLWLLFMETAEALTQCVQCVCVCVLEIWFCTTKCFFPQFSSSFSAV